MAELVRLKTDDQNVPVPCGSGPSAVVEPADGAQPARGSNGVDSSAGPLRGDIAACWYTGVGGSGLGFFRSSELRRRALDGSAVVVKAAAFGGAGAGVGAGAGAGEGALASTGAAR